MIVDANAILSQNQAVTVTAPSTNVYDTAGLGLGQAVQNKFGTATEFGDDIGGGGPLAEAPQLLVRVATQFTAGGSATLRVQLEAAVDTGPNSGTPGTWQVIDQTDDIAVALLTAGQFVARFTVPERYPGQGFPRFYRVNYLVSTGPMTAGTLNAAILTGIDGQPAYPAAY